MERICCNGLAWKWIGVGVILGSVIGYAAARLVRMTAMPEMVALFNGFGGLASLLVGWAEYHKQSAPGFDLAAGSWFHYQHHKYFECNYGGSLIPLDKWFNTFHDGTTEADVRLRKQMRTRRQMNAIQT